MLRWLLLVRIQVTTLISIFEQKYWRSSYIFKKWIFDTRADQIWPNFSRSVFEFNQTFREVYLNLIKLFENCIWILSNFSRSVFELSNFSRSVFEFYQLFEKYIWILSNLSRSVFELSNFSRSVFEFYQTFWEVYLNLIFEFLSFKCWICVPVCEEVTSMIEQLLLPGSTQKSGSHTGLVHLPGRIHLNRTRSTILSFEPVTRVYLLFILKGL